MSELITDNLQVQINNLSSQLATQINNVNLAIGDNEEDIVTINSKIVLLQNEDDDIHDEIHEVAAVVDNHTSRLNALNLSSQTMSDEINSMDGDIDRLQAQLEDMDEEHHEELHTLANAIDAHSTRLNSVEVTQAAYPKIRILSQREYDAIGEPAADTFYYTYDED